MKRLTLGIVLFLILGAIYMTMFNSPDANKVESSLIGFQEMAKASEISEATVTIDNNYTLKVTWFKKGEEKGKEYFFEDNAALLNNTLTTMALENNIVLKTVNKSQIPIGSILNILILVGLFGFMIYMMSKSSGGGGAMQFGKSKARLNDDTGKVKVTFKDVAGIDEVQEELQEIIDFLKTPDKFTRFGAKIPRGVLLVGGPGNGKTLIAKAVAGEADVPFYSISGSEFVELYVGVGASRVRDLFDKAKKTAPCIVFIDEIDAVGRQRGAGLGGGNDEREQTLNQLLVEMDGFEAKESVIVIAATNRPDVLDPALLRPGRFDRQVVVSPADVKGREAILRVHAKGKPLADDVKLDIIAKRTPGFSGADLANVVNEAALLAARKNELNITMESLEQAIEREIAGPEKKSKVMNDKEKKLVAYHEAGHAITSHFLAGTDPVHKISIIPRGLAGGYTLTLPDEEKNYITKTDMLETVCMLLGGRVAEAIELGDISTGASNDLERATAIIRNMIMEYGMTDELGSLTFGQKSGEVFLGRDISRERNYSEKIAAKIDEVAKKYIDLCYDKTRRILVENKDSLDLVATSLMEKEVLTRDEFEILIKTSLDARIPKEILEDEEV